jgi:diacylglycerol kinase family enzyme
VLPAGTADVWAREAGIPRDVPHALRALPSLRPVRLDVGRVLGTDHHVARRFLLMCSAGVDAEVVRRLQSGSLGKRAFGRGWYGAVASWVLARSEPADARVTIDGRVLDGPLLMALVGNTRLYGGVARLTAGALADDGLLDLCTFSGNGLGHRAVLAARALRGSLEAHTGGGIAYHRGARVDIETDWPIPVQADGEFIGTTPVSIEVEPAALWALVSRAPNPLLTSG